MKENRGCSCTVHDTMGSGGTHQKEGRKRVRSGDYEKRQSEKREKRKWNAKKKRNVKPQLKLI